MSEGRVHETVTFPTEEEVARGGDTDTIGRPYGAVRRDEYDWKLSDLSASAVTAAVTGVPLGRPENTAGDDETVIAWPVESCTR